MSESEKLGDYGETIRELSEQIVAAQRPIRILDALKWDNEVKEYFFKHHAKALPKMNAEYYQQKNPLNFDPVKKIEEFHEIDRNIRRKLGQYSGVGSIMQRMCYEYCRVVDMLISRGTPRFSEVSQELYGSSNDVFHVGAPTLRDFGLLANEALANISDQVETKKDIEKYTSEDAVAMLSEKLGNYFSSSTICVELSDGIIADAAAGAEKIKIRSDAKFSKREIRSLEVHEGWVHLGTTLNGMAQPICTFLSKGPPSSTVTQEGLAIIAEIFAFASFPARVRRTTDRVNAEAGANFFDVYQYYREQGLEEEESYHSAVRVFRGSMFDGGPFTKDLSYTKGFILIYNFMRLAVQRGLVSRIPLLFVGKTTLDDLHILADLQEEGIITAPKYLPPQFNDLSAVSAWMVYSLFLNRLDLRRLATDFKGILQ
jgi:uncharacterized protein (TIGR02421 family)